jgi:hypothetical protein
MLRGKKFDPVTLTFNLWPWKSIAFQILLRTKYVPSLVKIHWRMMIIECSQGCYGRTDGRTDGRKGINKYTKCTNKGKLRKTSNIATSYKTSLLASMINKKNYMRKYKSNAPQLKLWKSCLNCLLYNQCSFSVENPRLPPSVSSTKISIDLNVVIY